MIKKIFGNSIGNTNRRLEMMINDYSKLRKYHKYIIKYYSHLIKYSEMTKNNCTNFIKCFD